MRFHVSFVGGLKGPDMDDALDLLEELGLLPPYDTKTADDTSSSQTPISNCKLPIADS